jgi:hypothetical protein
MIVKINQVLRIRKTFPTNLYSRDAITFVGRQEMKMKKKYNRYSYILRVAMPS